MKRNSAGEQGSNPRKRALNFKTDEVKFFLHFFSCVAGVKRGRGRGNLGVRECLGRAREKGKERLQGLHCFLHFSCSDSEHENSDWSELIVKSQSST